MKICKQEENGFPHVKPGDLVEIEDNGLYLVCSQRGLHLLVKITNGNLWSSCSLWGNLDPSRVKVVTDKYCLKEI